MARWDRRGVGGVAPVTSLVRGGASPTLALDSSIAAPGRRRRSCPGARLGNLSTSAATARAAILERSCHGRRSCCYVFSCRQECEC
jgi:hypothetical protein